MATKHTFIYCRISADQQGRAEGVQAQERWGREYAEETWPGVPVRVYKDNDLSAAKDTVVRPEFDRMREAIRRGECANLWSVEQSRLARIEYVWFSLVADLVKADISELHTKRDGLIRLDDVVGGIKAVLSADEVRKLRKRLLDKKAELARQGRPGGSSAFGYRQRIYTDAEAARLRAWQEARHDARRTRGVDMRAWKEANPRPQGGRPVLDEQGRATLEIVPEEAEIIRQAADRILNGWSLTGIAQWLNNDLGIRGKHGGRFVATGVADFLTAPMIAGLRVYRGEITGQGTWEPILPEAKWRAVCAVIGTRQHTRHRARRSYLLTGARMICDCGKPMQAQPSRDYAYYRCLANVTDGCGKVSIGAKAVETHVADRLIRHLEELDAAGLLADDEHAARRAELADELEAFDGPGGRLADLSRRWAARKITSDQFDIMNGALLEERDRLEDELARMPPAPGDIDVEELRENWSEMTLDERRKVVDDWVDRVIIRPPASRPVTMHTVAARAGLSHASVWRVFNGKTTKPELVTRVKAAAREVGFEWEARHWPKPADDLARVEILWRR